MVSDLKALYNEEEYDGDVVAEKKRILSGESHDILQVKNLTKIYTKTGAKNNLIAVDRLVLILFSPKHCDQYLNAKLPRQEILQSSIQVTATYPPVYAHGGGFNCPFYC